MSRTPGTKKELHLDWEFRPQQGRWAPIDVPGPWQKQYPDFNGIGEYCTRLARPDSDPFIIEFEAVATEARVFVNDSAAGTHLGAWTPFRVDLTPHLHADRSVANEIVVRVDQKPAHTTAGFLPTIGMAFGGIWGRVRRVDRPAPDAPPSPIDRVVRVDGSRIVVDGRPLQLRGMLHWGYYPEIGAPAPTDMQIESEIAYLQSMGFNLVKFCLFVPPERYLDACDRHGLWVWQEYPVWDRPLAPASDAERDALLAEFDEMVRRDSRHPSVIVRTFTCENDRVDEHFARALYDLAKRRAPQSLVLDNSGWLSSEKVGDFYDEHPYLNNAEWRHYPGRMKRAFASLPPKPFLLGETMCADTWADGRRGGYDFTHSQRAVERAAGAEGVLERSYRIADGVRKYQAETLRRTLPDTGYVMNVMRDIAATPLGFFTVDGTPKFRPETWTWQADTMIVCDLEERSFAGGTETTVGVWVSHYGAQTIDSELRCHFGPENSDRATSSRGPHGETRTDFPVRIEPGETRRVGAIRLRFPEVDQPAAFVLAAALGERANRWTLWAVPPVDRATLPLAESLDPDTVRAIEEGADRIHPAAPRARSWRCPNFTWWSPVLWFDKSVLPEALVEDLICHDLLSSRVLAPAAGTESLLEVWDTHMEPGRVVRHPLVTATRFGRGRLIVSALRHDSPAGGYVLQLLARHLDGADPPHLAAFGPADSIMLDAWEMGECEDARFSFPEAAQTVTFSERKVTFGERIVFEGWRSFRARFDLPEAWHEQEIVLRCEAVGDAYVVRVDGDEIARAGNLTGTWDGTRDRPREFPLRLAAGGHTIRIDVRDWRANGGMVGPVWLTRTTASTVY